MKSFKIGPYEVGNGRPFIIAEVAQAHDGNLKLAHSYIDAAASTGVDAVKFQLHIAEEESTLDEPFRVNFSKVDKTRYDYWKRVGFSFEEWQKIYKHCADLNLVCLNSPFSVRAVERLEKLGAPAYKIGSGEVETPDIFEAIAKTGKPILLSSGMSNYAMLDKSIAWMQEKKLDFAIFQCTTKYPTPLAEVGLNVMHELKQRYDCPTGLSDHSANLNTALLAMAQGADLLEMHIALTKDSFGPDTVASLIPEQFKALTQARAQWQEILENPIDKNQIAEEMTPVLKVFSKSIAPRSDLPAGTVITKDMLTLKKPGSGIPPTELDNLVGCRLKQDVPFNRLLKWEDIEERHEEKSA